MIVGSLPIRIKSFKTNPLLLSLTRAFSGGLFLGVGLIHLLPEANEKFEAYAEENKKIRGIISICIFDSCSKFLSNSFHRKNCD